MKKQPAANLIPTPRQKTQLKQNTKNTGHANARYVYTEEDLGEGILYAGLKSTLTAGKKQFNPQHN